MVAIAVIIIVAVIAVVGAWMVLNLVLPTYFTQVRKTLKMSPYRRGAKVEAPPPGPIMCEDCGLKPRDRYYPPDINLCRDCFIDDVVQDGI